MMEGEDHAVHSVQRQAIGSRPMTIRLSPARARGRTAALIGVIVLLTGALQHAQSRTATASLVLQVRPEELLQDQNGSVILKIRLARGTTARLWAANSCTSPSPESQVITKSGIYSIPFNTLRPAISDPNSSASHVCLLSSDGMLSDSLPVVVIAPGNITREQGPPNLTTPSGVSVDVPAGWAVNIQVGTSTWSNPQPSFSCQRVPSKAPNRPCRPSFTA
jgi:hypothetical protein